MIYFMIENTKQFRDNFIYYVFAVWSILSYQRIINGDIYIEH